MQVYSDNDHYDLEKMNMNDYARSFYSQDRLEEPSLEEPSLVGPSLADINSWGNKEEETLTVDPTNPDHYQNTDKKYEHRFVAKAWDLEYYLSCATKYIARCGKKSSVGMSDKEKEIQDLKKSMVYIQFRIEELEGG